jgi:hypothetical protein
VSPLHAQTWTLHDRVAMVGLAPGDRGPALTPEQAGKDVVRLITGTGYDQDAYLLDAAGLTPAP